MKRLSVWLSEEQESEIIALAGGVGAKRSEWVRSAIDAAIDTARHPNRITIVPADDTEGSPVASPCAGDVAALQAEIRRLTDECAAADSGRVEALLRASDGDKEIANLGRLLSEKKDEIAWLRAEVSKLNDKLTPATLPERAGVRSWWRFWRK